MTGGVCRGILAILFGVATAAGVPAASIPDSAAWPVGAPVITGTLGEDRLDHFSHGIELAGRGLPVHPALPGDLVFRFDGSGSWSSVPRGTGAFVVLRHSQNILTLYAHLTEGTLGPVRDSYSPTDVLGLTGDSGRAEAPGLSFSVYDPEALSWVNPLALLPGLRDNQPPLVRRLVLSVGDQQRALATGMTVAAGKVAVLVEAYDLREDVRFRWPLAPYSIRLSVDGTEVTRVTFDSLSLRGKLLALMPSGITRQGLYAGDGLLNLGTVDLHPGESRLLVAVRDFSGNESTREVALTVTSPP